MAYERNKLRENIKELKKFMKRFDKDTDMYFLAEKCLELHKIVLAEYRRRK